VPDISLKQGWPSPRLAEDVLGEEREHGRVPGPKVLADVTGCQYELRPFQPGVFFGARDAVLNMALPKDVRHKRFAAQWSAGQRPAAYADTELIRELCERLGRAERIPA
jgi:hypothetical protein